MNLSDKLLDLSWWFGLAKKAVAPLLLPLCLLGLFLVSCVNYVDNYQIGYQFDTRNGEITVLPRTGYIVTWPVIIRVNHVDLRPMQVCMSAIQRMLNCKLVEFDPKGIKLFLSWHGRHNFDGPDITSSSNASNSHPTQVSETLFQNILKNYAYDGSGTTYPFLTILRELKPEEGSRK